MWSLFPEFAIERKGKKRTGRAKSSLKHFFQEITPDTSVPPVLETAGPCSHANEGSGKGTYSPEGSGENPKEVCSENGAPHGS